MYKNYENYVHTASVHYAQFMDGQWNLLVSLSHNVKFSPTGI